MRKLISKQQSFFLYLSIRIHKVALIIIPAFIFSQFIMYPISYRTGKTTSINWKNGLRNQQKFHKTMLSVSQPHTSFSRTDSFETHEKNLIDKRIHGKHITFNLNEDIDDDQVIQDYKTTFHVQQLLFSYLNCSQAFYIRAQELRHPLIFYYGHTLTMYINKFVESGIISERLNQRFQAIFAIGVDEMDWDDNLDLTHYDWPSVQEVTEYRRQADQIIINAIITLKNRKISINDPIWDILMCIEHHKIHIETSAAIIRRVPIKFIQAVPELKECPFREIFVKNVKKNDLVEVNDYKFQWKHNKNNVGMYLFDNELGEASSKVKGFKISKFQVSNGQFLEFILQNGYQKTQFWTEQGKAWLKSKQRQYPIYWHIDQSQSKDQDKYKLRTMSKLIQMPWDWPVQVNNLQASAFCAWKGRKDKINYQLPTQQEFFSVRDQNIPEIQQIQDLQGNFDRKNWFSPCPVDYFKQGKVYSIVGNTWEHTRTPYHAFSGFKIQRNFEDYSAPYFGDKHNMLFGGSFASGKKDAIVTRNWFRHHFYNFIGFRYTVSENEVQKYSNEEQEKFFEYDDQIIENIETHYFSSNSYLITVLKQLKINKYFCTQKSKALLIGVSVGRLALQLGNQFQEVIAIDYSARYFKVAAKFLANGFIEKHNSTMLTLGQLGIQNRQNIHFMISNPQNPDIQKVSNSNMILIDGKGLRKGKLVNVLKTVIQLKCEQMKTTIVVIPCKQNQNELNSSIIRKNFNNSLKVLHKIPISSNYDQKLYIFQH